MTLKRHEKSPETFSGFITSPTGASSPSYEHDAYYVGHPLQRLWKRRLTARVIREVLRYRPSFHLDIGCGSSPLPFLLAKSGVALVHGMDRDEEKVRAATRLYGYSPQLSFGTGIPATLVHGARGVRTASLVEVVEHMEGTEALSYLRTLQMNGFRAVVITTPDFTSLAWRVTEWLAQRFVKGSWNDHHHEEGCTLYTERSLVGLLRAGGFEPVVRPRLFGADMIVVGEARR